MSFDVDAWLDEAQPPTRAVKVYGRGDLVAALQVVEARMTDHERRAEAGLASALNDPRLAGGGPHADVQFLLSERVRLLDELEESAATLTVRGLLDEERLSTQQEVLKGSGGDRWSDELNEQLEPRLLAAAAVEPKLTLEQARRLRERIGQGQWDAVVQAMLEASRETIDVPLSRLGSGTVQAS